MIAQRKRQKTREELDILYEIFSAYSFYVNEAINPVSQAEFTMFRLKDYCQENRQGWTKNKWRRLIVESLTPLWSCELIDDLKLND